MHESPDQHTGQPAETTDWTDLMADYDWRINIVSNADDPAYEEGLDMVNSLKDQYGDENVVVNLAVHDADTESLVRAPGKLGVHVRKDIIQPGQ